MARYFTVCRRSRLDTYLQWAFPYRNYIGEPRDLNTLMADLVTALFLEVSTVYRDDEMIMCRNTRFDRVYNLSHVFFDDLADLIRPDIIPSDIPDYCSHYSQDDQLSDVVMEDSQSSDESYYSEDEFPDSM